MGRRRAPRPFLIRALRGAIDRIAACAAGPAVSAAIGVGLVTAPPPARAQGPRPLGREVAVASSYPNLGAPRVARAADGTYVVLWESGVVGPPALYGQRYAADGRAVGAAFQVASASGGQGYASVAMAADGDFVVVWAAYGEEHGPEVFAQPYTPVGLPAGPAFRVNTTAEGAQSIPSVAMGADGFVVAWQSEDDGDEYGVYARRYASDGTPRSGEVLVNVTTALEQSVPVVAMAADGGFVVVWESERPDADLYDVYARWYGADSTPEGGEVLVSGAAGYARSPAVAMDGAGRALVVWEDGYGLFPGMRGLRQDPDGTEIHARRYAPGGAPLGAAFRVNTHTRNNQAWPAVALDADGDALVVWQSRRAGGGTAGIYGQRYTAAGTAHGTEFQVDTAAAGTGLAPGVAVDAVGNAVVVWVRSTYYPRPGRTDLFARRFRGPGR